MFFKKTFKSKLNRPLAPNVFRIPGTFAGISRIQRYPACVLKLKKILSVFCFSYIKRIMKKLRVTCEIHDEGKRARKMKN